MCFRRTTTLGACLLVAVMTNVVLVNFFYDVQVKVFSSLLLAMALYLLALELRRLWAFFVGDGPVPLRYDLALQIPEPTTPRTKRAISLHVLVLAVVLGAPTTEIVGRARAQRAYGPDRRPS